MLIEPQVLDIFNYPEERFKSPAKPLAWEAINMDGSSGEIHMLEQAEKIRFNAPKTIQGTPYDRTCLKGVTEDYNMLLRPKRLKTLPHARVVGWNALLSEDHVLYAPEPLIEDERARILSQKTKSGHFGFVLRPIENNWSIVYYKPTDQFSFARKAIFLSNLEPSNYGSFLFRTLPRLLMLPELHLDVDCLILSDRSPWILSVLNDIGIDLPIFVAKEVSGVAFDEIYFFPDSDDEGLYSSSDLARIRKYASSVASPVDKGAKRIYVSRKLSHLTKPHFHPMLNEQKVEEFMAEAGFDVVYPETLTFKNQIKLFSQAEVIVGPSGSGMLNACFAKEGAVVLDLESYTTCVRQHAKIYSSTGKEYGFCFGKIDESDPAAPKLKRWEIDLAELKSAMHEMRMI